MPGHQTQHKGTVYGLLTYILTLTYLPAAEQVMQLLDDGTPENRWTGAEGERLAS